MLKTALKAHLPMVSVKTDDTIHLELVLAALSGMKVVQLPPKLTSAVLYLQVVMWTNEPKAATAENYQALMEHGRTLVFVNCAPGSMAPDFGWIVPPQDMVLAKLGEYSKTPSGLLRLVQGMSLKAVEELLMLTAARFGDLTQKSVRAMRMALGQAIPGLYPMTTDFGYYEPLPELETWLKTNIPYFLSQTAPAQLVPRGLLFDGPPGTGKTMAARWIARWADCPLYRLETATTLTKYIGESEGRLAQSLSQLDNEGPCVVLIDEVEKVFNTTGENNGVIERMLSQLLWWLAEHKSKVLTVMTTNNKSAIPPEMYRPGRIDRVLHVPLMDGPQATQFARRLLTEMLKPGKPALKQINGLQLIAQPGHPGWSHSDVSTWVADRVKESGWIAA